MMRTQRSQAPKPFVVAVIFTLLSLTGLIRADVSVPPGKDTLPDAVEAGGPNEVFVLDNDGLYEISRNYS